MFNLVISSNSSVKILEHLSFKGNAVGKNKIRIFRPFEHPYTPLTFRRWNFSPPFFFYFSLKFSFSRSIHRLDAKTSFSKRSMLVPIASSPTMNHRDIHIRSKQLMESSTFPFRLRCFVFFRPRAILAGKRLSLEAAPTASALCDLSIKISIKEGTEGVYREAAFEISRLAIDSAQRKYREKHSTVKRSSSPLLIPRKSRSPRDLYTRDRNRGSFSFLGRQ